MKRKTSVKRKVPANRKRVAKKVQHKVRGGKVDLTAPTVFKMSAGEEGSNDFILVKTQGYIFGIPAFSGMGTMREPLIIGFGPVVKPQ